MRALDGRRLRARMERTHDVVPSKTHKVEEYVMDALFAVPEPRNELWSSNPSG